MCHSCKMLFLQHLSLYHNRMDQMSPGKCSTKDQHFSKLCQMTQTGFVRPTHRCCSSRILVFNSLGNDVLKHEECPTHKHTFTHLLCMISSQPHNIQHKVSHTHTLVFFIVTSSLKITLWKNWMTWIICIVLCCGFNMWFYSVGVLLGYKK